jgi:hypothetical protein
VPHLPPRAEQDLAEVISVSAPSLSLPAAAGYDLDAAARRCSRRVPSDYEYAIAILERLRNLAPILTDALIDTLGRCDKRALPFSSEPNAALPRSRPSGCRIYFCGALFYRRKPPRRLGGRGVS